MPWHRRHNRNKHHALVVAGVFLALTMLTVIISAFQDPITGTFVRLLAGNSDQYRPHDR